LETPYPHIDFDEPSDKVSDAGGIQLNFKRVLARAIRFWYLIILSLLLFLLAAFLLNRYSTRIYPVKASIIIKENEENVGAKFLYNNELINPYRNFYNELYIMKSYPLLQEVMESLDFDVSLAREGDIKTTEYYDPDFPLGFNVVGGKGHLGKTFRFEVKSSQKIEFSRKDDSDFVSAANREFNFGDTISINGLKIQISRRADVSGIIGKPFLLKFHDSFTLARQYSAKLNANWAQAGASVVNLEVQGPVPQKEIDFLNRFIERYQHYDVEKKNKVANMALKFLDDQLLVIGDSLKIYEDQVERFKDRNIITNLSEETNRLYQKLQGFEDQKFQYRLTTNYYSYIKQLLDSDNYDGIFTPGSVGISDDIISGLIEQLIQLQTEVNIYKNGQSRGAEKFQDNPRLEEKLQRIAFVKNDIIKTIENSQRTQQINVKFIDDQIKLVENQLARLPRTERELVSIQRNYSLKENLYVFLLQKRTEAGLSKASTTSDIVVVNPPIAGASISPKVAQNYGVAAALGLAIPFLVFIVIELLNNRIQSREDIERISSAPMLGAVGHNQLGSSLVVMEKPRSAIAESFRALRSNLNYFTGGVNNLVIMITSSVPGEGKSFTTLNLATVLALAGKRTIIVGADLRKPKLYDDLGLTNDVGLSQYLSGMIEASQIIQHSKIENLSLIPGGPMPPNPSELLLKDRMEILVRDLRKSYDYILIDTPPLSLVADGFVLSRFADHTIFIVRQDYTPRAALETLNEYYLQKKLANLSILFNDLRKSGMGYGYGGYGYGYGYGYGTYRYGYRDKSAGYYGE